MASGRATGLLPTNTLTAQEGCESQFVWDSWLPPDSKQERLGDELQIRSFQVVPDVNYGQWFGPTAYRNNLKGVIISPVPFFWNISKG